MNPAASRLTARLLIAEAVVGLSFLAVLSFVVPQLLLLDDEVTRAASALALKATPILAAIGFWLTYARLARHKYLLRALAVGSTAIEPEDVFALSKVPSYLTSVFVSLIATAIFVSMLTPLRPALLDWDSAVTLTLVGTVIVATVALPLYVFFRAEVARVLELVQPDLMSGLLIREDATGRARQRILRRVLLAIVTPVGFVAIGAALIANAHVRTLDEQNREETAETIARVALEAPPGTARVGRAEAIAAASEYGFFARVEHGPGRFAVERGDRGQVTMTTPIEDGVAVIRFYVTSVRALSRADLTIALVAVALALALGFRFGKSFTADLAFATRNVRILGTQDILHASDAPGTTARYAQVAKLNRAIGILAERFRVFAAAQERAIEARDAASRTRSLLFASVSHDLRSPLNAILGFTELVGEKALNPAQRESLTLIRQRGRELLSLIETILDVAKLDAGRLVLVKAKAAPATILAHAVRRAHAIAPDQHIDTALTFDDDLPLVEWDRMRIIQAINALIGALIRVVGMPGSPAGTRHTVQVHASKVDFFEAPDDGAATRGAGAGVRIEIAGPAGTLSPEELKKLLAPVSSASGHRPHGGLTLAVTLAHALVDLHGGTLEIGASKAGSASFALHLPAADAGPAADVAGGAPAA